MNTGNKKILSIILLVILVAGLVHSYTFISTHSDHQCTHADCPVCMQIDHAMRTISSMKILPTAAFCLVILCLFTLEQTLFIQNRYSASTLITLKVLLLI